MQIDYDQEARRIDAMSDLSRTAFVVAMCALLIVAGAALTVAGIFYGQ